MKKAIILYKEFYNVPEDMSDAAVISEMVSLTVFLFTLGFFLSQFIVFLVD